MRKGSLRLLAALAACAALAAAAFLALNPPGSERPADLCPGFTTRPRVTAIEPGLERPGIVALGIASTVPGTPGDDHWYLVLVPVGTDKESVIEGGGATYEDMCRFWRLQWEVEVSEEDYDRCVAVMFKREGEVPPDVAVFPACADVPAVSTT